MAGVTHVKHFLARSLHFFMYRVLKRGVMVAKHMWGQRSNIGSGTMKRSGWIATIIILMFLVSGCVSSIRNDDITVTGLDSGGFLLDPVGNFDVYTGSFSVANPTNRTVENLAVDITLIPAASYCHGMTKTFTIPRLEPLQKEKVQMSIAEFGNLNCQYDYAYRVTTTNDPQT